MTDDRLNGKNIFSSYYVMSELSSEMKYSILSLTFPVSCVQRKGNKQVYWRL
jgi:hypothetical protein